MKRQKDITAILENEETRLDKIKALCEVAARAGEGSAMLQLEIKSFLENLRSVLEYLAHEVREACCPPLEEKDRMRFGFPIVDEEKQFAGRMKTLFPGLDQNHPRIYSYLRSIQPFLKNPWLKHFRDINNRNKHEALAKHRHLQAVSGSPEEKELGPIVFLVGDRVDRTSFTAATWASLKFSDGNENIILLLMQSLTGIQEIEYELALLLNAVRPSLRRPAGKA